MIKLYKEKELSYGYTHGQDNLDSLNIKYSEFPELSTPQNLTGYTSDPNWIVSASNESYDGTTCYAWRAFNGTSNNKQDGWGSNTFPCYMIWQNLTQRVLIKKYQIRNRNDHLNYSSPYTWKIEGSNNGTDWEEIDSQTNVTSWSQNELKTFTVPTNNRGYFYHRIYVTEHGSDGLLISELNGYSTL